MKFHIAPISDPSNKIPMSNVFSSEMLRLSEHTVPARNLQKRWTHLKDLPLHDCNNVRPLLLIGSDRPDLIVPIESHFGPEGAPVAVRTKLGWAVQGPTMNYRRRNEINLLCRQSQSESDAVLHENVHRLWRNDVQMYADRKQVGRSKQDQKAVDLLDSKSTYMMVEGVKRIATPLLWRCDEEMLSCPASSVLPALRRNEHHLRKDPERAEVHRGKIQELKGASLVRVLTEDEKEKDSDRHWYFPHHVVIQNGKSRLVFNCAFQYQGKSLNDCLLPGPILGSSLIGVLLRFRKHQVAVSGDIKAMFHCVQVLPSDRSMLRFLWRELEPNAEIEEMEWNVLPFGTTCSPCCASYALQKHIRDNCADPDVLRSVVSSFYVDNCLDGKSTVAEAKDLVRKLCEVLGTGGFPIVKWASNLPDVITDLPEEARSSSTERWLSSGGDTPEEAALGPRWNFACDTLTYRLEQSDWPFLTRRAVLSDVMRCAGKYPPWLPYAIHSTREDAHPGVMEATLWLG